MRIAVTVHRARLGANEFRVIRPAEPLVRAALLDDDRWVHLHADTPSARRIGMLWLLAARSRRSLVHLSPCGVLPEGHENTGLPQLDLVLLHHSLQFPTSRWKALRARLGRGRPQTADVPESDLPEPDAVDRSRHHRENRDLFDEQLHAATLFLVGSADVFRATADRFFDVGNHEPGTTPNHYCAELHPGDGVLGPRARRFHVVRSDAWS